MSVDLFDLAEVMKDVRERGIVKLESISVKFLSI